MNLKPTAAICLIMLLAGGPARAADPPSAKLALSFEPIQQDVEYERVSESEYGKCRVEVERTQAGSGWVVFGPTGQVIRRFVDTNGDNVVDQWRYYLHGIEVYRDIDSDFNKRVDQSRWLNTGGTRWAIDKNEDGEIDHWKVISAEEVSRVAVRAMAEGDAGALKRLLIDAGDIRTLGIDEALAKQLLDSVSSPETKLREVRRGSKLIAPGAEWLRFDGSTPGTIPADAGKATQDLRVYENTMAIVEAGGETGLVQIGELVRVGETWKLTQIPRPLEGNSVQVTLGGLLMQPGDVAAGDGQSPVSTAGSLTPEMQKLFEQLQELDRNAPSPGDGIRKLAEYNGERTRILEEIVELAETGEQREQWVRQMVDGIIAAVQTETYPGGIRKLEQLERELRRSSPDSPLVAYVAYRKLLGEYSGKLQEAGDNESRQKVLSWWLEQLEAFTKDYPESDDAAEAMLQLAISQEFAGKLKESRQWYEKIVARHPEAGAAARAAGAVRRLDLEGETFSFSGSGLEGGAIDASRFRGKVLLVDFWATWCKPCEEDLPQIRALYERYRDQGFEILGVNLDLTAEPVPAYLKQHRMTWPQIHEEGGLESTPAETFGIITLPTMFLVDREGKVVSRSTSVEDLKTRLPELIKKEGRLGGK